MELNFQIWSYRNRLTTLGFFCRVSWYPDTRPKLSLPGYIFQFQFSVNDFSKILAKHLSHTNGSRWFFVNIFCVGNGGANELFLIYNVEEIITVSPHLLWCTLIKQEKLVFILVILYIWEYLRVFREICFGYSGIRRFPISGIWSPKWPKTQPYFQVWGCLWTNFHLKKRRSIHLHVWSRIEIQHVTRESLTENTALFSGLSMPLNKFPSTFSDLDVPSDSDGESERSAVVVATLYLLVSAGCLWHCGIYIQNIHSTGTGS